jgi:hypothetical protein
MFFRVPLRRNLKSLVEAIGDNQLSFLGKQAELLQ